MNTATIVLAQLRAKKIVLSGYKARGIRRQDMLTRDITIAARDYLNGHPALIAEAAQLVECWRVEGVFGKRAQRGPRD